MLRGPEPQNIPMREKSYPPLVDAAGQPIEADYSAIEAKLLDMLGFDVCPEHLLYGTKPASLPERPSGPVPPRTLQQAITERLERGEGMPDDMSIGISPHSKKRMKTRKVKPEHVAMLYLYGERTVLPEDRTEYKMSPALARSLGLGKDDLGPLIKGKIIIAEYSEPPVLVTVMGPMVPKQRQLSPGSRPDKMRRKKKHRKH